MNRTRRALAWLTTLLVVLAGPVLVAAPAHAAGPTTAVEPKRVLLVAIYAVAVLLVAGVVAWAAYSQWGPRAQGQEEER